MKIQALTDHRGTLTWTEGEGLYRAYWMTGASEGTVRGDHALRTTTRTICVLRGAVGLRVEDGKGCFSLPLMEGQSFTVEPMKWTNLHGFSRGAVVLVLADKPYSLEDHVYDYAAWAKEVGR